jgi:predicted nucleic acid-binding protein
MTVLYLDTSALVKRYVLEAGSQELRSVWMNFDITGVVRIVQAEMAAALAKGQRMGWLTSVDAQKAWLDFMEDWHRLTLLEPNARVVQSGKKELESLLHWQPLIASSGKRLRKLVCMSGQL